jgi:magnesium chelatase family protein
MVARVATVAFLGLDARGVDVQVQIARGNNVFNVVGLPDKAVAESKERVRATLSAIGLSLPFMRITVNLSPADLPKEGSHYDLPIALGLLAAMGVIDAEALAGYVAVGELALDGRISPVPGVLLAALHASANEQALICPRTQGGEAAWAGGIEVLAAPDLLSLLNHFKGTQLLSAPEPAIADMPAAAVDLADIKGQETAKRALEVAAAGGHNLLMSGPPGAGKSLLAAALPGILPPLTPQEALEVSMVASVAGELEGGRLIRARPFRSPHHSASMAALVGGGARTARRGQPRPPRRAVPRRASRVPAPGARQPAPAARDGRGQRRARRTARHLPGARPAYRSDEPLPLRPLVRPRAGLRARTKVRRRLPGETVGSAH